MEIFNEEEYRKWTKEYEAERQKEGEKRRLVAAESEAELKKAKKFDSRKILDLPCSQKCSLADENNSRRLELANGKIRRQPIIGKIQYVLQLLLVVLLCARADGAARGPRVVHALRRSKPLETARLVSRNVFETYIQMPVDHFDPENLDMFPMRLMFNEQFFGGPGSPVFIKVGGEDTIKPDWLQGGNMFYLAKENNGYMVYTEHRYYGNSVPYRNFTLENLRYLTVNQSLADLAYLIRSMTDQPRFAESKVVLYGGSYAGNLVLWFKQRYPHLAEVVVASSAPLKAEVNNTGNLEVVHDAFYAEGGDACIDTIRQGILDTVEALKTEEGRRELERAYRLCYPLPDYDDVYELGYFAGWITWKFAASVQEGQPGNLLKICNNFAGTDYGYTPMEKIGGYIAITAGLNKCWIMENAQLIDYYSNPRSNSRAWYYQTCTEFGNYQTAPTSGTVFDPFIWVTVDYYTNLCKKAFTESFNTSFVYDAVERTNKVFGGLHPDVHNFNKTINVHGTHDPWHVLGIYDRDLKEGSPTILVQRASHCFDTMNSLSTDTLEMTMAKQKVRRIVASWLN